MRFCPIIIVCLLNAAVQGNRPSIEFDFLSKDFGNVIQGQVIKQVFQFTNKGEGLLEIIDTEKS
jgi:hypothetical protein